jgi:medium-chain acyl-[acyl-carrier-protein] hydrolase
MVNFHGSGSDRQKTSNGTVRPTRLYCFPYAGCATFPFSRWTDWLPRDLSVRAIALPGRGRRLRERPLRRMDCLAERVTNEMTCEANSRFILFGHSMGALLAFEIARRLRKRGLSGPDLLIVSACRAPHLPSGDSRVSTLPDREFILELKRPPGAPVAALDNLELMTLLLPMMRADIEVCDTYEFVPGSPLDCPIAAITGNEDSTVRIDDMEPWRAHTNTVFSSFVVAGNHFSMLDPPPMTRIVTQLVETLGRSESKTPRCGTDLPRVEQ